MLLKKAVGMMINNRTWNRFDEVQQLLKIGCLQPGKFGYRDLCIKFKRLFCFIEGIHYGPRVSVRKDVLKIPLPPLESGHSIPLWTYPTDFPQRSLVLFPLNYQIPQYLPYHRLNKQEGHFRRILTENNWSITIEL